MANWYLRAKILRSKRASWQTPRHITRPYFVLLIILAIACLLASVCIGSVVLTFQDVLSSAWSLITSEPSGLPGALIELRLQRALNAMFTGASLSLAGVLMQALLRNPLADPYVLGISGGAAVGALTALLCTELLWVMNLSALTGALLVALTLFLLARRDFKVNVGDHSAHGGIGSSTTLLLTGVVVSSGCMAIVALLLSLAPDSRLRSMIFWMIGDLSGTQGSWLNWCVLVGSLMICLRQARAINIVALHPDSAGALGVSVGSLRQSLFFCAALLTASAVSSAGSIGFVGLIIPHACRFAFGPDHRVLLPTACLAGGCFLVLADTIARTLIAPQQLPVGVISALIGVPVFLLQLHQQRSLRS